MICNVVLFLFNFQCDLNPNQSISRRSVFFSVEPILLFVGILCQLR